MFSDKGAMLMAFKRADRVADVIKSALTEILLKEVSDERLTRVTVTDVVLTEDLKTARIFFVPLGAEKSGAEKKDELERAAGFLRRELARRVRLRHVPQLLFVFDESFDYGDRIDRLLQEIKK